VWYLVAGRALPNDADEFEDPDGTCQGTDAYASRLIARVVASGKASQRDLAALREAFPDLYPAAEATPAAP
jgi:hypothetical protein